MHPQTPPAARAASAAPGARYCTSDNTALHNGDVPFESAHTQAQRAVVADARKLVATLGYEACVELSHALLDRMEALTGGGAQQ